MSSTQALAPSIDVATRFRTTRQRMLSLIEPLTPEDDDGAILRRGFAGEVVIRDTTWFFESFVLREFLPGYRVFNPDFQWLFNSYYVSFAAFPGEAALPLIVFTLSAVGGDSARKHVDRAHVDSLLERLLDRLLDNPILTPQGAASRIELGANHEEQHQELILTDILHAFFTNPLRPAYRGREMLTPWRPPGARFQDHPSAPSVPSTSRIQFVRLSTAAWST